MHTSTPLAAQQLAAYAAFAQTLADRVRPLSRQWFRHPLSIDTKADESPVTQADREVEAALRAAISQQYPEHGIFGEEYGVQQAEAEFVWSLDPIDGTRAFISGNPVGHLAGVVVPRQAGAGLDRCADAGRALDRYAGACRI